jgi:DNA-binding response OmpR family regulator
MSESDQMENSVVGKHILLVEDDFFVRDIYQKKLHEFGFEVVSAENGLEGMKHLKKQIPDLILLDIFMPYMDGREMLREIRGSAEWKNIPVVLLTNFSASEGVRDGFELGADEYLIKSHFTPSEVLQKIKKVFEEREKNGILKRKEDGEGTEVPSST